MNSFPPETGTAPLLMCTVETEDAGQRLDKLLSLKFPQLSRSRAQQLIASGMVTEEKGLALTDAAQKMRAGVTLRITVPPPEPVALIPRDIPLDIRYEDAHLLVLNKPAGMTVHPAPGHRDNTLVHALLSHCGSSLSGIGGEMRPGIVHRLDKDTSGLMIVAKTDAAHQSLASQLSSRSLSRTYHALVWGVPALRIGKWESAIGRSRHDRKKMAVLKNGGRHAVTHYRVQETFGRIASLLECKLETGRTHQIRVHATAAGHPLIGDPVYGRFPLEKLRALPSDKSMIIKNFSRQALHAAALSFIHPITGENISISCAPPPDFSALLDTLKTLHFSA